MSTTTTKKTKPAKPYDGFPLFAHASGYWAKKIHGKHRYFGKWEDWKGALATFQEERDDWYAGRDPKSRQSGELQLEELCETFYLDKEKEAEAGNISRGHLKDLHRSCKRLLDTFGRDRAVTSLTASEFTALRTKLQKVWAPPTLLAEAGRVQSVFNYAYKTGLLEHPLREARSFARPTSKSLRLHRQTIEKRFYTAEEVTRMLAAARGPLKAFIYLGVNCGFGNFDCAKVPVSAFDLDKGWVEFPRPKTGVARRCWLWAETVEAVRVAMAVRPAPKLAKHRDLVFLTSVGLPWSNGTDCGALGIAFRKLQKLDSVNTYRKGVGFYALRHTFATVADGCLDDTAKESIMGHVDSTMAANYREHIDDDRLRKVAEHVRNWLLAAKPAEAKKPAA